MSFRRRGEIINRADVPVARLGIKSGLTPLSNLVQSRSTASNRLPQHSIASTEKAFGSLHISQDHASIHPGIKPSPATSQPTTSTGSHDFDLLLGHTGLPLGQSLLVEEEGTTEFALMLSKLFGAQGIAHNRLEKPLGDNTHIIVITNNPSLIKEFPGLYKGNNRETKRSKIDAESQKISVENLSHSRGRLSRSDDLKIAWRYSLGDHHKKADEKAGSPNTSTYNNQFDITTRLLPTPTNLEVTVLSPTQQTVQALLQRLDHTLQQHSDKLVRIIWPSILHPAMYPPRMFIPSEILGLTYGIRALLKKHHSHCVLFATISKPVISPALRTQLYNLHDGVITIDPFAQDMLDFLERSYKSQPNKVHHGLIHVLKLPIFSERGEMKATHAEWSFKNSRKRFHIEEWSIPVEEDSQDVNETDFSKPTNVSLDY